MKRVLSSLATCSLAAFIAAAPVYAAEPAAGMPDEAMMKKMMELTSPGEAHKVLDALTGDWNYTVTFKMAPDAPAQISSGTSSNKWILGGRYLEQKVSGTMDMNGETRQFDGLGIMGYDNIKQKYSSVWIDNMSTGMMISSGVYDATSKTIKESGNFSCPMKGDNVPFESELQFVDANHFTYIMYDLSEGKRFKGMEIKYTRK